MTFFLNAKTELRHPEEARSAVSKDAHPSCGLSDPVFLGPAEPSNRVAFRPVLAADPAGKANLVEEVEQIGVMDLADIRLVPSGVAGNLDMRVVAGESADLGGEVALHDLDMVEVELELQVGPADALDDPHRLAGVIEEIAGNVAGVDRLDDGGEAGVGDPVGGPAQIVDIDALAFFPVAPLRPQ